MNKSYIFNKCVKKHSLLEKGLLFRSFLIQIYTCINDIKFFSRISDKLLNGFSLNIPEVKLAILLIQESGKRRRDFSYYI